MEGGSHRAGPSATLPEPSGSLRRPPGSRDPRGSSTSLPSEQALLASQLAEQQGTVASPSPAGRGAPRQQGALLECAAPVPALTALDGVSRRLHALAAVTCTASWPRCSPVCPSHPVLRVLHFATILYSFHLRSVE